jgi:DNA-binding response OmpR family regulator
VNTPAVPQPHILSIDDEVSILQLVKEYLELNGFRVSGASTPRSALDIVKQDPPDLVITDLQLPESDGLALIPRLREHLPEVPIILLTGVHFESEMVDQSLSPEIAGYVNKTAPLSSLLAEVNRHFSAS